MADHTEREPVVTIVVVPRERFSVTRRALEAVYANTRYPFRLVYVDGGSPPAIRRYLAAQAVARGFTLVRTERYLVPNEARNISLRHVRTPYVLFMDNDVIPEPGWLEILMRCAEETGASMVGPLYFMGRPDKRVIHMAGGQTHITMDQGQRHFFEEHRFTERPIDEVRHELRREPCELIEFHCMLVRSEVLERLGPLDEGLMSQAEHSDLCLLVREQGGTVYFEPEAAVTYVTSGPLRWFDYPFFVRRWSEAWNDATFERFSQKWSLDRNDEGIRRSRRFGTAHRQYLFVPLQRTLVRIFGWRVGRWLVQDLMAPLETRLNRWLIRLDRPRDTPAKGSVPGGMHTAR